MRVAAIILVETRRPEQHAGQGNELWYSETMANRPLSCFAVMGRPILQHFIERLREGGVSDVAVIPGDAASREPSIDSLSAEVTLAASGGDAWNRAEKLADEFRRTGITDVLLVRLGAYAEIDVADVGRFHCAHGRCATRLFSEAGALDIWMVKLDCGNHVRLPLQDLMDAPVTCFPIYHLGSSYVNRLQNVWDLRRLVRDGFLSRCMIKPPGIQLKPGVWIDEGARVHHSSRLVAPIYLGRDTVVPQQAVVTRFSHLEEGSRVGWGTVVDNTSVLANTYIGQGLKVENAVVSEGGLIHLGHRVAVQVEDHRLLGAVVASHGEREEAVASTSWMRALAEWSATDSQKSAA